MNDNISNFHESSLENLDFTFNDMKRRNVNPIPVFKLLSFVQDCLIFHCSLMRNASISIAYLIHLDGVLVSISLFPYHNVYMRTGPRLCTCHYH